MTMLQARTFSLAIVSFARLAGVLLEVPADARFRFTTAINGDATTASNPITPADFMIKSRLVKFLSLFNTHIPLF
jgi:hypothetical protein